MKRNEIITKLIAEGFTEKTLANMNDKQLGFLSKRILGEEVVMISKTSPTFNKDVTDAKKLKKTIETYEGEVKEEEVETKEAARTFANQNRKNMPQGTKFQAGRANPNKFKQEERAKVNTVTKPYKTLGNTNEIKEEEIDEKKNEKWIQKAIKKPGALKKSLGVGKDEKIPAGKLKAASKKGGKMGKRANLAMTLKKLHEGDEVREWIEGLVKENYHTLTTKDEIMELIKVKLNEQNIGMETTSQLSSPKAIFTKKQQQIFNFKYGANLPLDGNWKDEKFNELKKRYLTENNIPFYICRKGDGYCNDADAGEVIAYGKEEMKKFFELVNSDYIKVKNDSTGLNNRMHEQSAEPGIAEPTTKPTTKPGREKPAQEPGKGKPFPNPWEPPQPGKTPDPTPKFQDDGELPDFLETDAILAAIKGHEMDDEISNLTEMIMKELKK